MYNKIDNNLKEANYCTKDSDCDIIMLGGSYIEFGCYHYINKSVDKQKIYDKMEKYNYSCNQLINECDSPPPVTCISNKCISSKKQ